MRTREDYDLLEFAQKYIEESDNVENLRSKGRIHRVSIERLCAGPALPLIYEFFAKRDESLKRELETSEGKSFNDISGEDIVNFGMH